VIAQLTPKRGAKAPVEPVAMIVSTYRLIGEVITPCTGVPTLTAKRGAVALSLPITSVGVSRAPNDVAPDAEGTHEHRAIKGERVVVATLSQPTIGALFAENATLPATLAVATIIAGSNPKTPLPPERINVGVLAAKVGESPIKLIVMIPNTATIIFCNRLFIFLSPS
jgi:hypothetical protein